MPSPSLEHTLRSRETKILFYYIGKIFGCQQKSFTIFEFSFDKPPAGRHTQTYGNPFVKKTARPGT
jgi:hypothetical protein